MSFSENAQCVAGALFKKNLDLKAKRYQQLFAELLNQYKDNYENLSLGTIVW